MCGNMFYSVCFVYSVLDFTDVISDINRSFFNSMLICNLSPYSITVFYGETCP